MQEVFAVSVEQILKKPWRSIAPRDATQDCFPLSANQWLSWVRIISRSFVHLCRARF